MVIHGGGGLQYSLDRRVTLHTGPTEAAPGWVYGGETNGQNGSEARHTAAGLMSTVASILPTH